MAFAQVHGRSTAVRDVCPNGAASCCGRSKLSARPVQLNRAKTGAAQFARKRLCVCSAVTPAQLDSANAQENGVGKAQAGTTRCYGCQADRHCITDAAMLLFDAAHTYEAAAPSSRTGRVKRQTKETKVDVSIGIDGTGRCKTKTPIHFLNHMLDVSPYSYMTQV